MFALDPTNKLGALSVVIFVSSPRYRIRIFTLRRFISRAAFINLATFLDSLYPALWLRCGLTYSGSDIPAPIFRARSGSQATPTIIISLLGAEGGIIYLCGGEIGSYGCQGVLYLNTLRQGMVVWIYYCTHFVNCMAMYSPPRTATSLASQTLSSPERVWLARLYSYIYYSHTSRFSRKR